MSCFKQQFHILCLYLSKCKYAVTFNEIYHTHKNLVYNVALQYVQNREDALEITQDVFVTVHEKITTFKQQSAIKTWLYRIAVNMSLDFIRARKRQKRWAFLSALRLDDAPHIQLPHFDHPGVKLEQKQAIESIYKAINQLPDNQKTVIILMRIEQQSQAETAAIMNLSVKAVESLFQRAKKNLEIFLNRDEGSPEK